MPAVEVPTAAAGLADGLVFTVTAVRAGLSGTLSRITYGLSGDSFY
jgi:hypothetical protein